MDGDELATKSRYCYGACGWPHSHQRGGVFHLSVHMICGSQACAAQVSAKTRDDVKGQVSNSVTQMYSQMSSDLTTHHRGEHDFKLTETEWLCHIPQFSHATLVWQASVLIPLTRCWDCKHIDQSCFATKLIHLICHRWCAWLSHSHYSGINSLNMATAWISSLPLGNLICVESLKQTRFCSVNCSCLIHFCGETHGQNLRFLCYHWHNKRSFSLLDLLSQLFQCTIKCHQICAVKLRPIFEVSSQLEASTSGMMAPSCFFHKHRIEQRLLAISRPKIPTLEWSARVEQKKRLAPSKSTLANKYAAAM